MNSMISTVLPTPAPPNSPVLPPFDEGAEQIDHLDAGLQDLARADCLLQRQWTAMDIAEFLRRQRVAVVQRFAEDIQQPPQAIRVSPGHAVVRRCHTRHAPVQAGAAVQRDGAQVALIEVLMHLEQTGFVIEVRTQGLPQGR